MNSKFVALDGVVASALGDWSAVRAAVASAFGERPFVLLAEDGDPKTPPHFTNSPVPLGSELPRGRAFNTEAEIRWRKIRPRVFSIVFLAEGDRAIPQGFAPVKGPWGATSGVQKLTGARSPKLKDWIETSVPGISGRYAELALTSWTAIVLKVFNFERAGIYQMTRYCELAEFKR